MIYNEDIVSDGIIIQEKEEVVKVWTYKKMICTSCPVPQINTPPGFLLDSLLQNIQISQTSKFTLAISTVI